MNAITQQIIIEARTWLGVREVPPGSNSGPEVDGWLARVHLPPGNQWCAAGAWCWLDDACRRLGLPNPLRPCASTHKLIAAAREIGAWTDTPGAGFLGGIDHGGGHGHTVVVCEVSPDGAHLRTVEGNEGNRVAVRSRLTADVDLGYLDPGMLFPR